MDYGEINKINLYNDIDECIKNIYKNKNLNKLIDDDERFKEIIQEIDSKFDLLG